MFALFWGTVQRHTFDQVCTEKCMWLNTALHRSLCPESTTALHRPTPQQGLFWVLPCTAWLAQVLCWHLGSLPRFTPNPWFGNVLKLWTSVTFLYAKRRREQKDLLCLIFESCVPLPLFPFLSYSWCKTLLGNTLRKTKIFLQHQWAFSHSKRASLCDCLSVPVLHCPQAVKFSNPH